MANNAKQCDCTKCQELCRHEPGWFLPDEIEAAASFLNLTRDEFVQKYLTSHPLEEGQALAPAYRFGKCVFFERGRCSIHSVKPYECRNVFGCESPRRHRNIRDKIIEHWLANLA